MEMREMSKSETTSEKRETRKEVDIFSKERDSF